MKSKSMQDTDNFSEEKSKNRKIFRKMNRNKHSISDTDKSSTSQSHTKPNVETQIFDETAEPNSETSISFKRFIVTTHNPKKLKSKLFKINNRIEKSRNMCVGDPCGLGKACVPGGKSFICICGDGTKLSSAEQPCPANTYVDVTVKPKTVALENEDTLFPSQDVFVGVVAVMSILVCILLSFVYWKGRKMCVLAKKARALHLSSSMIEEDLAKITSLAAYNFANNPNYYISSPNESRALQNLSVTVISKAEIEFLGEIGEGCFGRVYKGLYKPGARKSSTSKKPDSKTESEKQGNTSKNLNTSEEIKTSTADSCEKAGKNTENETRINIAQDLLNLPNDQKLCANLSFKNIHLDLNKTQDSKTTQDFPVTMELNKTQDSKTIQYFPVAKELNKTQDILVSKEDEDIIVAVKILKDTLGPEAEADFMREVEIMSTFKHPNILTLIGVVASDIGNTPWMVFEYMPYGDLAEVLRSSSKLYSKNCATPSQLNVDELLDICLQVSRGMNYLSVHHFVHRDLASRNCLVGSNLTVKISDFGMSRDVYTCDYYKVGGSRMLPIRWMSPESILYGKFTLESDVWSFGVVLWEIFSLGKQPYYGHCNEDVVQIILEGNQLEPPELCPAFVKEVMKKCWVQEPHSRLTFSDVVQMIEEGIKKRESGVTINNNRNSHPSLQGQNDADPFNNNFDTDSDSYLLPNANKNTPEYLTLLSQS